MMPEPDFDPAPNRPHPYVDSARWAHLLSRFERPEGIAPSVWWAWKTQTSVPHLPRLAYILKVIGIPEQEAIKALGWAKVHFKRTPVERIAHQTSGDESPARPMTIEYICRWCLNQRRTASRKAAEAQRRQELNQLPIQERQRRTAERDDAKAAAQAAYRGRRASIADRARLGYQVPRLPNGRIDYGKLPVTYRHGAPQRDWRSTFIRYPEDDVEIT